MLDTNFTQVPPNAVDALTDGLSNHSEQSGSKEDEEPLIDEDNELINFEELSSLASRLFRREGSSTCSLSLTGPIRNVDSWVWKMHVFVAFMMAYTAVSSDEASFLLSFTFSTLGPLIKQDSTLPSGSFASDTPRKLITPCSLAKGLDITDTFFKHLVCVSCGRILDWDGKIPAGGTMKCRHCPAYTIFHRKPQLVYTRRTVEMIIASVLQDGRLEAAMEESSHQDLREGRNNRKQFGPIWSGNAWRQDCTCIKCSTPCRESHTPFVEDSTLNLKITINVNWFKPFEGSHNDKYSIGFIMLRIDNLPEKFNTPDLECRGIHLVSLLPGSVSPHSKAFSVFLEGALRLITEEIQQLDEKGVKIATALHPKGKFGFPPFSIASLLDRS